jgi:2-methylisocitrate lyase-like PEP mutase family enzyme
LRHYIVVFARSDARSAESLEEALWRVAAFADAGADALFIDALRSREEMEAFCAIAPGVPKMANMLEGGGSTPICTPAVGRCRLTVTKPVLKAPMGSALET